MNAGPASSTASARTASVIVTYNPPAGLDARLHAALDQTDFAVVVDNGSAETPELRDLPAALRARVSLIANPQNVGLAAALNQGIAHGARLGATQALLLDHDSTLGPGLVEAMRSAERALGEDARVAAVVPTIRYAHPNIRCRWPSSTGHRAPFFHFAYADRLQQPTDVDLAIGSGMLLDIETWNRLGRFDEQLFIDLVDTEFCLRARAQQYRILAVPGAFLQHELGHVVQRQLLGTRVFPTHHSATRHYYISRNRVILARRYAKRFPSWLAYELLGGLKLVLKSMLFEADRWGKLRQTARGTIDGLRGRTGPIPDAS